VGERQSERPAGSGIAPPSGGQQVTGGGLLRTRTNKSSKTKQNQHVKGVNGRGKKDYPAVVLAGGETGRKTPQRRAGDPGKEKEERQSTKTEKRVEQARHCFMDADLGVPGKPGRGKALLVRGGAECRTREGGGKMILSFIVGLLWKGVSD